MEIGVCSSMGMGELKKVMVVSQKVAEEVCEPKARNTVVRDDASHNGE